MKTRPVSDMEIAKLTVKAHFDVQINTIEYQKTMIANKLSNIQRDYKELLGVMPKGISFYGLRIELSWNTTVTLDSEDFVEKVDKRLLEYFENKITITQIDFARGVMAKLREIDVKCLAQKLISCKSVAGSTYQIFNS